MRINKKAAAIAIAAVTLAGSGIAYAYWSTGGSGSGVATSGTTTNNLTITATGWAGLAPGTANAKSFTVKVTNPNTYAVHVSNVSLDTSYGGGTGVTTDNAACLSSWFSVGAATTIAPNADVAALGNTGDLAFSTITMSDELNVDQNSCKSPTQVTIHFTSN